ncbi:hypothetical protein PoB_003155000 [Plakobranchus ocellatus]|uniref:Uncharacterized protein n=1 Tax=Plakobranchus ocellatus TaxID=259542 RepID=A0AAV4ACI2_9GAST|nr:hypothetical protein PoB_003155000 [Plakobranchus ocellatus]
MNRVATAIWIKSPRIYSNEMAEVRAKKTRTQNTREIVCEGLHPPVDGRLLGNGENKIKRVSGLFYCQLCSKWGTFAIAVAGGLALKSADIFNGWVQSRRQCLKDAAQKPGLIE